MNKKILWLISSIVLCLGIIAGLLGYSIASKKHETEKNTAQTEVKTTSETEESRLVETPLNDPVEGDFKVHTSENGYSIKYPADMTANTMAKSVDFILEDSESGSSLNIVTAKNDGTLSEMTREEFEHSLLHTSGNSELLSYEKINMNGIDTLVAEYTYMESVVKQYFVFTDTNGYCITVMKSDYISDEMSQIFDNVAESFTLN